MDDLTIKLLEQQKNDIKDLMAGQSAIISARVDAKIDQKFAPLKAGVEQIIKHQEYQNGQLVEHGKKMAEHEERMVDLEKEDIRFRNYQMNCPANKLASKFYTKKFWILAGVSFTVVYIILATIWHTVGIGPLVQKLISLL